MLQLSLILKSIRFIDLIDIGIVSLIVYRFFLIIQGTRAFKMLIGLLALAGLLTLSSSYSLYSLSWLLKNFFDYLFLILIVLFQDQIKSALVALTSTKLFSFRGSQSYFEQSIEEVIDSCIALSKEKTGALIVFENDQGLQNFSSTGTFLDCKIHSDIIYSLFQTKSPLHDGAIIIRKKNIQAAGCFLPLSKNVEIDRHFGTRHRAALGITEVSDAVVVIVSEETGKINVCFDDRFYPIKSEDHLRSVLRLLLIEKIKGTDFPIVYQRSYQP